jgi:hypothetical protein
MSSFLITFAPFALVALVAGAMTANQWTQVWEKPDGSRVHKASSEDAQAFARKLGMYAGIAGFLIEIAQGFEHKGSVTIRLAVWVWIGAGIGFTRMDRQRDGDGLVKVKKEDLLKF